MDRHSSGPGQLTGIIRMRGLSRSRRLFRAGLFGGCTPAGGLFRACRLVFSRSAGNLRGDFLCFLSRSGLWFVFRGGASPFSRSLPCSAAGTGSRCARGCGLFRLSFRCFFGCRFRCSWRRCFRHCLSGRLRGAFSRHCRSTFGCFRSFFRSFRCWYSGVFTGCFRLFLR